MSGPKKRPKPQFAKLELVEGELINFDDKLPPKGVPWKIGEMRIVTESQRLLVKHFPIIFSGDEYDLHPAYQRRHRWDQPRRSLLIESLILNVPIPPVFLYEDSAAKFEVMDGLQRITTILDFYKDKFPLNGLEFLMHLEGKKYSEMELNARRQLDRSAISAIVLLSESASNDEQKRRMKELVFQRINTGGVTLSDQEKRNALISGPMNDLCSRLSKNDDFRACWGWKGSAQETKSMKDIEYVLRFFALRQRRGTDSKYSQKFFLDEYMKAANRLPSKTLQKMEEVFITTFSTINVVLGGSAFRGLSRGKRTKKLSPVMYDATSQAFSLAISKASKDKIIEKKTEISQILRERLLEKKDDFRASYGQYIYTETRINIVAEAILEALD